MSHHRSRRSRRGERLPFLGKGHVSPVKVSAQVEPLEERVTPTTLTTFDFTIPARVANQGVQLALFGNVPPAAGASPSQMLYLTGSSGSYSYQNVPSTAGSKLSMITLASPSTTNTLPVSVSIPIPTDPLQAGEAVIFVGSNAGLPIQTSGAYTTGYVTVPTVTTNPGDVFSLFELTNTQSSPGVYSLDVDISEIDQLGFTYTVTSSSNAPYPLAEVGTTPARQTLFNQFQSTFATSNTAFLESLTLGQNSTGQQLRLVAPQTILGTFEQSGPNLTSAAVQATGGNGGLTNGTAYYYLITATSATGETLPSANLAYAGQINNSTSSVVLNWQPYTGITNNGAFVSGSSVTTGYNIYRGVGQPPDNNGSHPPALDAFQLIASVTGASTTTFTDPGQSPVSPSTPPPTNSYGFDPLSTYFTAAIENFFNYYRTNTFSFTQSPQVPGASPTVYIGHTVDFVPDWEAAGQNIKYTALQLTGQAGGEFAGVTLNIYQPLFSTNTKLTTSASLPYLPPMPTWMSSNLSETPSQMIFGCDGAFATNKTDPDVQSVPNAGDVQNSLGNLENVIVSAFNRGLAGYAPGLQPNQWVNPAQFTQDPTPGTGGTLSSGSSYYYLMTAVLANGGGETVPTREVAANLSSGQSAVTLTWTPLDSTVVTSYNIYRGTASGAEILIANVSNTGQVPVTSYTDTGALPISPPTPPPWQFYAANSTSNLYSAFLHQNSTTNPATGISINGLVYGYPFDDQGNFSTNIQYPAGSLPGTVTFAINDFSSTPAVLGAGQAPASVTAGTPFSITINADTGATVAFTSSDPHAVLPASYTFLSSDHGTHTFSFALDSAGAHALTILDSQSGFDQVSSILVTPAAANHLVFAGVPGFTFVRTRIPVNVDVVDAYGNLVPTASGTVSLSQPGLRQSLHAQIQNGVAQFRPQFNRPGLFYLAAYSSSYGTASFYPISVSNASRYAIKAGRTALENQPFTLLVTALNPSGRRDWYYQGMVDVYTRGKLVGEAAASDGVATVSITPTSPGRYVLNARDSVKPGIRGRAGIFVPVVDPLPTARVKRFAAESIKHGSGFRFLAERTTQAVPPRLFWGVVNRPGRSR